MEPTVFTDVEDHMYIAKEESFGPVMVISKFKNGYVLLWWLFENLLPHFHPMHRNDKICSMVLFNLVNLAESLGLLTPKLRKFLVWGILLHVNIELMLLEACKGVEGNLKCHFLNKTWYLM